MAAPGALAVANAGFEATMNLGPPECWLVLAEVACYLATSPKSWASYKGLAEARRIVAESPAYPVPLPLRNATDDVSRAEGAGEGYEHASRLPPGSTHVRFVPQELGDLRTYSAYRRGTEVDRAWERRPADAPEPDGSS
jgi:putative ATPase